MTRFRSLRRTETKYESLLNAFLESGANFTRRNRDKEIVLHIAVKVGNMAAAKILLRRGANIHASDRVGRGVIKIADAVLGEAGAGHSRSKQHSILYGKIIVYKALVTDARAVGEPSQFDKWSLLRTKISTC